MIKLVNWLTKIIIQTMIIASLTVYLTWVTVHTYVDKLLAKYHLDSAESKIDFSDFLSQMSTSLNILKPSSSNNQASEKTSELTENAESTEEPSRQTPADPETTDTPVIKDVNADQESTTSPNPTATPVAADSQGVDAVPDDSISVWNQSSGASGQEASKSGDKQKELVMSAEEFTKMKDELNEADKVQIFTLLAARLPQTEFQQLSTYVEDGVTEAEWADIQKMVEQYLEPDEYKELQDLLANY
ncbi:hypothetical protein EHS13_35755 [Paenibacillus psychroresistens]|uniref:DUF4476 domain-containing protein n=1 Tax=Paenibacillus psychroresistens TaxID=1778678 RepID=A0A6B8RVN6_9BACL|nr:hypothetical protein [Paenibacillus psychroresistens]QGQ99844.1 hypothetical protein EHS13_35755 [Paenibacillus psychroresistens]